MAGIHRENAAGAHQGFLDRMAKRHPVPVRLGHQSRSTNTPTSTTPIAIPSCGFSLRASGKAIGWTAGGPGRSIQTIRRPVLYLDKENPSTVIAERLKIFHATDDDQFKNGTYEANSAVIM